MVKNKVVVFWGENGSLQCVKDSSQSGQTDKRRKQQSLFTVSFVYFKADLLSCCVCDV